MKPTTSWEKESSWYSDATSGRGNYYHDHVVIPNSLRLLRLASNSKLLDLGCGSGVLGRALPKTVSYIGVDIAPSLIAQARREDRSSSHSYIVGDITKPLSLPADFTHAAIILTLQNVKEPATTIRNAARHLVDGGSLIIVLNHPAFRIPRQSSWGIDEQTKLQYRRINRYLSPLEIPITMHPGKEHSGVTWSYHLPISAYTAILHDAGFLIEVMEEWTSDKVSVGKAAKMENRARSEFPLFLAIAAVKKTVNDRDV